MVGELLKASNAITFLLSSSPSHELVFIKTHFKLFTCCWQYMHENFPSKKKMLLLTAPKLF